MNHALPADLSEATRRSGSQVIILCGFGWSDIVTSVTWVDDDGTVVERILGSDGRVFARESSCPTLTHRWSMESSYSFFRPVVVSTLQEGLWLLGNDIAVLDNYPEADLEGPTHRWRLNHR